MKTIKTYTVIGSGIDIDGWHKYTLERNDGKIVKVTRSRLKQLKSKNQIVEPIQKSE